jgi:DNA-directed RNA polymerase subunit RPC12/RpoP
MPITFRCFRCNQVLRTGRQKAGSVVACPKCGAELIVPEPTLEKSVTGEEGSGDNVRVGPSRTTTPKPEAPDLSDIRVEDIRVEPGVVLNRPEPEPEPQPQASAEPPPMPFGVKIEPEPLLSPRTALRPRREAPAAAPEPSPIPSIEASLEFPAIDVEPLPVRPEPPAVIPDRAGPARPRDLVLPEAAVVSWSLFVILALFLAFVAGLLAGHFVWTVKVLKVQAALGWLGGFG